MKQLKAVSTATLLAVLLSLTMLSRAWADGEAVPAGGTVVFGLSQSGDLLLSGKNSQDASQSVAHIDDSRLHTATRIQTRVKPANMWDLQLSALTIAPVTRGDILLATFQGRVTDSMTGGGTTQFVFERAADPYTKSCSFPAALTHTWARFFVPFVAKEDYAAGQAAIHFQVGTYPQTIEIADVEVRNYGKSLKLGDLPQTSLTYKGRALDAPWRAAALDRIDKLRKGDFTVKVVDREGRAVKGASVSIRMARQAFRFGTAIRSQLIAGTEGSVSDQQKYAAMLPQLFNSVTMESEMKWYIWDTWGKRQADNLLPWLQSHNLRLRGHNLLWGAWHYVPDKFHALAGKPADLATATERHITEEAQHFRGDVDEWDVVNEPVDHTVLTDIVGNAEMVRWYQLAHAADPGARLVINDVSILTGNGDDTVHRTAFDTLIAYLLAHGAPLQELGIECHFDQHVTEPAKIVEIVDDLSRKYKLPIEATEYDLGTRDEQLQADYMRDFLTAMYSEEAVNGITIWGFWEGAHWRPDAALFRKDWSVKPNGQVWMDLVRKAWWTNADGVTDASGKFNIRGFYGEYAVTVTANGRSVAVPYSLLKARMPLTITIP